MVLSSAWEMFFFPDRKWIVFIFYIYIYTSFCRFRTMLLFYVEFLLNDSGRCCLRPKLSILYSMYPIMIIFINIYIIFKKMVCISNLLNQLLGFMNWFFYLTRRHPTCNNNSISGNIKGTYFSSLSLSPPRPSLRLFWERYSFWGKEVPAISGNINSNIYIYIFTYT